MRRNVLITICCTVALIINAPSAIGGSNLTIENVDPDSHYPAIRVHFTVYGLDNEAAESFDSSNLSILEDKTRVHKNLTLTRQPDVEKHICMVFSIDSSRSISREVMPQIRKTARDMIKLMDEKNKIALFRFNDKVVKLNDFTANRDEVINNINKIQRHGKKTLLYDSIYDSIVLFDSIRELNKKIVVFTDGKDEGSVNTSDDIIHMAKKEGIPVYFICIKGAKDMQKMARISKQTGGKVVIGSSEDIASMYGAILTMMKNRYLMEYETSLTRDGKSHSLEIRLKKGDLRDNDSYRFQMATVGLPGVVSLTNFLLGALLLVMILLGVLMLTMMNKDKRLMREQFENEKGLLREMIERIENAHHELNPKEHGDFIVSDSEYRYQRGLLVQKDGLHRGKRHTLGKNDTIIGSGDNTHIRIRDASVSSQHAKIAAKGGSFIIFDLISDGGTQLNGKKLLRPKALHDWDEIKVGKTVLIFRGFADPA